MYFGGQTGKQIVIKYNPPAEKTRKHEGFIAEYSYQGKQNDDQQDRGLGE